MPETILLVDDDANLLAGFRRSLGREFRLALPIAARKP